MLRRGNEQAAAISPAPARAVRLSLGPSPWPGAARPPSSAPSPRGRQQPAQAPAPAHVVRDRVPQHHRPHLPQPAHQQAQQTPVARLLVDQQRTPLTPSLLPLPYALHRAKKQPKPATPPDRSA